MKLTHEKKKCFKIYFDPYRRKETRHVNIKFVNFLCERKYFVNVDFLRNRSRVDIKIRRLFIKTYVPPL